mgnify:FL=1
MMFLSSTAPTELPFDIDLDTVKHLLDGVDPATLLPDVSTVVGKVQLVCTLAILVAPLVMLVLGIAYLFFAPKEANYYFGYRTAFGMGSVSAWRRTQKLAGLVFSILGLLLTVVMLLVSLTLPSRAPMDMVWLAVKCLLWQGALALLSKATINGLTMLHYNYRGTKRTK